jgi:copper chaperone
VLNRQNRYGGEIAFGVETPLSNMSRRTVSVTDMACTGCEENVESALEALDGVSSVEVDHEADTVEIEADDDVSDDEVAAAIEDAGYEVAG